MDGVKRSHLTLLDAHAGQRGRKCMALRHGGSFREIAKL